METTQRYIKNTRRRNPLMNGRELIVPQSPNQSLRQQLQSKLQHNSYLNNLIKHQRVRKLAKFLLELRGSNLPIEYQGNYNFKQKWEAKSKQNQFQTFKMEYIQGWYFWFKIALFPLLIIQIWFLSIFRVFQFQSFEVIFILGLIQEIVTFFLNCYFFYQKIDPKQDFCSQFQQYFKRSQGRTFFLFKIYSIIYYTLLIANVNGISETSNFFYIFFDLITLFLKYTKVQYIYSKIKFKAIGSKYKNYMNLFDLLSNILIILHCFAILLYSCTYYDSTTNWMTKRPPQIQKSWISDYLISFYFSSTTMLTVGYGDLTPSNELEMVCVIFVQLLGISFNGYFINEIGVNLSQMRRQREKLQKDLSNAQKLARCNKMSLPLKQKMYNEILKHQEISQELQVSQQESLMNRINHQIKHQIQEENQIKIAKSCLFFICNFTKRFQIQLSKKLNKVLYPPNTTLIQAYGKERLYIIARGQVDVMAQKKFQNRAFFQKVLKTIDAKKISNFFLSEIYGVSAFFSGKPSRIRAVAKNHTSCYYLQQSDIFQTIMDGDQDFEKYHYFKIKYHLQDFPEKFEVPSILSRKQHYVPNIFYLIKKHKKEMQGINSRQYILRLHRRIKKAYEVVDDFQAKQSKVYQSVDSQDEVIEEKSRQSTGSRKLLPPILARDQQQILSINKPRAKLNRQRNMTKYLQLKKMRLQQKYNILIKQQIFKESFKEYRNYLPKCNISAILSRFQKNELINEKDTLITFLRQKKMKKSLLNK